MARLRLLPACACMVFFSGFVRHGYAHETDQYTLPVGREFADVGPYLNEFMYDAIAAGVEELNEKIDAAVARGASAESLAKLRTPDAIAEAVYDHTPPAYALIEGMETVVESKRMKTRYAGLVVGYKEQFTNIYQNVHFILDPRQVFRIWHAATFKADGVYMGGDKIGHFADMGVRYYRPYRKALKNGATMENAVAAAVKVGTDGIFFSEKGAVGYLSAGAYSNADLAANYVGFLFYRNLTEPVELEGEPRPPMCAIEDGRWVIAPHVRSDSGFFNVFLSEHFNEVINPSRFEGGMRGSVRKAVRGRREEVLYRYTDALGYPLTRRAFVERTHAVRTYFGQDYGHLGDDENLVTAGAMCFETVTADSDVATADFRGRLPLHTAAEDGDVELVKTLLARGATVDAPIAPMEIRCGDAGCTSLHLAARGGHAEVIATLLAAGAAIEARDARGATPLHHASAHAATCRALLEAGADANTTDESGRTPLHWAARLNAVECVTALLESGANSGETTVQGWTTVHEAAAAGSSDALVALLEHGANPMARAAFGRTALHLAAASRHARCAQSLLAHGADPSALDEFGFEPIHDAAAAGSAVITALLIDAGADANAMTSDGRTPLHLTSRYGFDGTIETLLEADADASRASANGSTPLHEAAFSGRESIVRALLAHGADADGRDQMGRTARNLAESAGHAGVARLLEHSRVAMTRSQRTRGQ